MDEQTIADLYEPIRGGYRIRITDEADALRAAPGSLVGAVGPLPEHTGHERNTDAEQRQTRDDPRLHRRPLFPPADRRLLWTDTQLRSLERMSFRPLILAYNAPRFVFDFHSAGGLLGHLRVGWVAAGGFGAWLDEWSQITVRYVDGRMEYVLRDPALPGTAVALSVVPLAEAVGAVLRYRVNAQEPGSLVWYYGGASAFFTNYSHGAPFYAFSPAECARDRLSAELNRFALRREFAPDDSAMEAAWGAPARLVGWSVTIRGGGGDPVLRPVSGKRQLRVDAPDAGDTAVMRARHSSIGLRKSDAATGDPGSLLRAADLAGTGMRTGCVAFGDVRLATGESEGYLVVGAGGNVEEAIGRPRDAYRAALERNASIAARVIVKTPNPHLDAAAVMTAFSLEGTWGDIAYLHGGWSWRSAYLGWRGWYGPLCYGWADRVARSIRSHVTLGLITSGEDRGALGSRLEWGPRVFYNMNEVFLDHVRHYFDHTGDLELMRTVFPVLQGIVAWESRRLQPGTEHLYENSLNTWISDSHWYTGSCCSQASAYMLGAHRFLADLAGRLGERAFRYREIAARIAAAMQRVLWQPYRGVFAECRDATGERLLHPEPELPTLYHTAEFDAADSLQIDEMLHWAEHGLRQERTQGGGRMYWSSAWHPNNGRAYTHSTSELAYAEQLNFALMQARAGRADQAWELVRACLCGVFNGPTPGGLSCHAYTDGRQRANDEFGDAISMFARAIVEGVFGIAPRRQDQVVRLTPAIPASWPGAEIRTPSFGYRLTRCVGRVEIEWKAPEPTSVHLRLSLRASAISGVRVDEGSGDWRAEPGVGLTWVLVDTPISRSGSIRVEFEPGSVSAPPEIQVDAGSRFCLDLAAYGAFGAINPQAVLLDTRVETGKLLGTVRRAPGRGLLYLDGGTDQCPVWIPVSLRVTQSDATPRPWSPPETGREPERWTPIDLGSVFNASLTDVLERVVAAAEPPASPASSVGYHYRNQHLRERLEPPVSDAAWRAKVDADGIAWTADGVPFRTARQGPNIAVVTRVGGFPDTLEVNVRTGGRALYLMLSGITFPMQSHVPNVRLVLRYASGADEITTLVNPFGIGDCWGSWLGRFHDTSENGFENLGGRFGPEGSSGVVDLTRPVAVDTEAHLVRLPLRPGAVLGRVRFEAVANDVVFGIMGLSVLNA